MKNYEIKLKIALDDNGYILKNNWIYDAIAEQLENGEIIEYFKIRKYFDDGEAPKFEPQLD